MIDNILTRKGADLRSIIVPFAVIGLKLLLGVGKIND